MGRRLGRAMVDAPMGDGWLVERMEGGFTLLVFAQDGNMYNDLPDVAHNVFVFGPSFPSELLFRRYDARRGTIYLIRPDRYVAARWRQV